MRENATKQKLRAGEPVFGCWVRYPDPGVAELLALQGFDFLVFGGEHGTIQPRDFSHPENLDRAAIWIRARSTPPAPSRSSSPSRWTAGSTGT